MLAGWVQENAEMRHQRPETVPLATVMLRWYSQHAKKLPSGEAYRYALLRWSDFFGPALVSEVTPARIREFIGAMRAEKLSPSYIRRTLAAGKAALSWAVKEGEITAAPFIQLTEESEARERVMTIEEARHLLRAAAPEPLHVRRYLMLAFATAARPAAILELTTWQCSVSDRTIHLNPRGRKQNKKRRPSIPMAETIVPMIEDAGPGLLIQWNGQPLQSIRSAFERMGRRARTLLRVEAAPEVRALWRAGEREAAAAALKRARAAGDAMLEITAYTVRHTMATEMRRRGAPVWEIAGFLGHSSGYKTTERYAKISPDHLVGCVRAIDAYFVDLGPMVGALGLGPSINPGACELRATRVKSGGLEPPVSLVEPRRIELLTSTMPL